MATLYVLQGPDKGRTFRTLNETTLLGRETDQIPLTDRTVSRQHAELRPNNGHWLLRDLDSANGTYVNGVRVASPVQLSDGDQVKVGSTLMLYGGEESIEKLSGSEIPKDAIHLDVSATNLDSSILSTIPSNEESVVIAAPEMAEAARSWKVIYELTELIGAMASPEQLLERVMDIIFGRFPVDRGFILLYEERPTEVARHDGEMVPRVVRYHKQLQGATSRITTSRRIINHVVEHKQGVLCTNAMTDDRFAGRKVKGMESSIHEFGLHSVICAPIMARDTLLGVIHLDCSMLTHTYTEEQLRLVTAIGLLTGMALENARLVQSRVQVARLAATGETVAYLSHYIKNILQGMQSGADLVNMGLKRERLDTIGQGWQICQRNLDKTLRLSMNMLAFSKHREPKRQQVQLNKVVADAVSLAQRRADDKGVVLLTELEETFPPIPIDADGIHQVALNIIMNAIDAVDPEQGAVTVQTHYDAEQDAAVLSISDNGPGIPRERRETIFEPFTSDKGQGGTGLGLTVARKTVLEHGGRIAVESEPGEGTTFRVWLPTQPTADSEKTFGPAH